MQIDPYDERFHPEVWFSDEHGYILRSSCRIDGEKPPLVFAADGYVLHYLPPGEAVCLAMPGGALGVPHASIDGRSDYCYCGADWPCPKEGEPYVAVGSKIPD